MISNDQQGVCAAKHLIAILSEESSIPFKKALVLANGTAMAELNGDKKLPQLYETARRHRPWEEKENSEAWMPVANSLYPVRSKIWKPSLLDRLQRSWRSHSLEASKLDTVQIENDHWVGVFGPNSTARRSLQVGNRNESRTLFAIMQAQKDKRKNRYWAN